MSRPISKVAPGWWDYTTLDAAILARCRQTRRKRPRTVVAGRASAW